MLPLAVDNDEELAHPRVMVWSSKTADRSDDRGFEEDGSSSAAAAVAEDDEDAAGWMPVL
jgi:hypothetical protein